MIATKTSFLIVLLSLALISGWSSASPLSWLEYQGPPPGARAAGISNCMAAVHDDPLMVFWNPAGLAVMASPIFNLSYQHNAGLLDNALFSGPKRVNYIAYASQRAGFSWRSLARLCDEQLAAEGSDSSYHYLRYGADEFTLALAGRQEASPWSFGLGAKLIWARATQLNQHYSGGSWDRGRLWEDQGLGCGFDLGLQGEYQSWRLGISGQNLWGRVYWNQFDDDRLKPHLVGSLAWNQPKNLSIYVGGEKFIGSQTPRLRYSLGGEYRYSLAQSGAATLRAGYSQQYQGPKDGYSWSLGLGYYYKRMRLDASGINLRDPVTGQWRWSYVGSINIFAAQE